MNLLTLITMEAQVQMVQQVILNQVTLKEERPRNG